MALKFSANLNFLFTENVKCISERIRFAHKSGFQAVEIPYPDEELLEVVKAIKDTKVIVSLINIKIDKTRDDLKFGSASIIGEEKLFQKQLNETISFANAVDCKKIHLMAGVTDTKTELENLHIYTSNLRKASDLLRTYDIMGVIEPINKYAIPTYFMNSFEKASKVLTEINSPNLKLLVDLYHLQHISGNVTKTLEEKKNLIGHFQIAQAPNRNEPDTLGELNYSYVFQKLEDFGYDDWIGCEYKPKTSTIEGLDWISKFNYSL